MRYKQTWFKYESKLATFISFLQGGLAGFAVLFVIFMIPAIICLIAGAGGLVFGIMCGVACALTILTLVGLIFVDTDKLDDYMCKRKKKVKTNTQTTDTEQFFFSLFDIAKNLCPKTHTIWTNDFIVYSLYKTKLTLLQILNEDKNAKQNKQDIILAFNTLSLTMLKKSQPVSVLPSQIETIFFTRTQSYDMVFSKHSDKQLVTTLIRECLEWFLWSCSTIIPDGTEQAIPYGDYYYPLKTGKGVFSEEELKQIDELEFQTIDFLEKNIDNFISNLTKNKKIIFN